MKEAVEDSLAAIIGRTKAFEYAVRLLISAHPEPEKLQHIWSALLPTIVDTHMDLPSNQNALYRQALKEGLALVSQTIELIPREPPQPSG